MILIIKISQRYQFYYPKEYKLLNNTILLLRIISEPIEKFSTYADIEAHSFDYIIIHNISVEARNLVIKERDVENTEFIRSQPCTRASS